MGPYRRPKSNCTWIRATHEGRRTALRRRARPGWETGRRQEDAPYCLRGGSTWDPLGCADLRGMAAVGFTYLFGLESTWAHRLMVVTLAAVIGLVLFTIGALGHPFSGGARIGPGFFELVLERIDASKLSNLR